MGLDFIEALDELDEPFHLVLVRRAKDRIDPQFEIRINAEEPAEFPVRLIVFRNAPWTPRSRSWTASGPSREFNNHRAFLAVFRIASVFSCMRSGSRPFVGSRMMAGLLFL